MIQSNLMAQINKLSLDERVLLAHAIWEGVAEEARATPLTKGQQAELQRRLEKYGDSTDGVSWEEVRRELIEAENNESLPRNSAPRGQTRPQGDSRVVRKTAQRTRRRISKRD